MRTTVPALLSAALMLAVIPAYGNPIVPDLTIALDSSLGSGYGTSGNPLPGFCVQPNCVLFTGTLTDNDVDLSFMQITDIELSTLTPTPATGGLTLDNSLFFDNSSGYLVGDPAWANDGDADFGLQNYYSGPLFGIDIENLTTPGFYEGTVTISTMGGTNDTGSGQTFTQSFTVEVTPEPAAAGLLLAGLLPFAAWRGVKRKWRSFAASR